MKGCENYLSPSLANRTRSKVKANCEQSILDCNKEKRNRKQVQFPQFVAKRTRGEGSPKDSFCFWAFGQVDWLTSQQASLLPNECLTIVWGRSTIGQEIMGTGSSYLMNLCTLATQSTRSFILWPSNCWLQQ